MSYLIQKPTLQLDNYQILSIEILFHTQHHIHKSKKNYVFHKETKSLCHQVDKRRLESKGCVTLYHNKAEVQLRNFYQCELVLAS